ncbi:F-box only protein 16 isoform X13 [Macaca fascicularis]|uniref:F-box only protein 16 isoform X13 n=1 Tax=Macaca fascicularis TaxID=9541 RepID=UPI003D15BA47
MMAFAPPKNLDGPKMQTKMSTWTPLNHQLLNDRSLVLSPRYLKKEEPCLANGLTNGQTLREEESSQACWSAARSPSKSSAVESFKRKFQQKPWTLQPSFQGCYLYTSFLSWTPGASVVVHRCRGEIPSHYVPKFQLSPKSSSSSRLASS